MQWRAELLVHCTSGPGNYQHLTLLRLIRQPVSPYGINHKLRLFPSGLWSINQLLRHTNFLGKIMFIILRIWINFFPKNLSFENHSKLVSTDRLCAQPAPKPCLEHKGLTRIGSWKEKIKTAWHRVERSTWRCLAPVSRSISRTSYTIAFLLVFYPSITRIIAWHTTTHFAIPEHWHAANSQTREDIYVCIEPRVRVTIQQGPISASNAIRCHPNKQEREHGTI